jgi:hypothetical protein
MYSISYAIHQALHNLIWYRRARLGLGFFLPMPAAGHLRPSISPCRPDFPPLPSPHGACLHCRGRRRSPVCHESVPCRRGLHRRGLSPHHRRRPHGRRHRRRRRRGSPAWSERGPCRCILHRCGSGPPRRQAAWPPPTFCSVCKTPAPPPRLLATPPKLTAPCPASLPPLVVGLPRGGLHRRGLGPPHRCRPHVHNRRRRRRRRGSPARRGRGPCRAASLLQPTAFPCPPLVTSDRRSPPCRSDFPPLPSPHGASLLHCRGRRRSHRRPGLGCRCLVCRGRVPCRRGLHSAGSAPLTGAGRTTAATVVDAGAAPLPSADEALTAASSTGPGPLTSVGRTAAAGSLPSLPPSSSHRPSPSWPPQARARPPS